MALNSEPTAAEDRDSDPSARGETAAESFNDAYDDIPEAERSTAIVLEAFLGTEPNQDLSRLIDGTARTTGALIRNENALRGLITNFNTTMAAFAAESGNLRTSIRELPLTLTSANRALASLNEAFPSTRAFAREIIPGVRETPATIDAALPWIDQARPLMGPRELGGVAKELAPASQDLARLTDRLLDLLPQTDLASKCARDVLLPTGDVVIQDEFTTGVENYKEFFYTLVGLSGEGQNFDGNGMYVRFQTGGGAETLSLGSASSNTGELFGNAVAVPLGNRPFYPGTEAAVPAERAVLPADAAEPQRPGGRQVGADRPGGAGGQEGAAGAARQAAPVRAHEGRREVSTAIRKHWRDFAAIIVLLVISLDRRRCTSWPTSASRCRPACRCSGKRLRRRRGRAGDGPGRHAGAGPDGQHRRRRGRRDLERRRSRTARAVIGLKIEREHATIYRDASILMRPKTGLKDMVAELNPGTPGGRRAGRGRADPGLADAARTSTSTRSSPRSTPTRATT